MSCSVEVIRKWTARYTGATVKADWQSSACYTGQFVSEACVSRATDRLSPRSGWLVLVSFIQERYLRCSTGTVYSKQEKARWFINSRFRRGTASLDVHPSPPSSRPTFDAVSLRETHKFQKYSDSCAVLGWLFRPFSTFGEFGPCASDIITRLALLLTTSPQSFPIVRQRITQSISVALMKVVGFQLVCGLHSYLCEAGDDTVLE